MIQHQLDTNEPVCCLPSVISQHTRYSAKGTYKHAGEEEDIESIDTSYRQSSRERIRVSFPVVGNVVNQYLEPSFTGISEREFYRYCSQAKMRKQDKIKFSQAVSKLSCKNQQEILRLMGEYGAIYVVGRMVSSITGKTMGLFSAHERAKNLEFFICEESSIRVVRTLGQ